MANVKELKVRIGSTKSTLKITSAMKLVSAAKLSKAQAKIQGFKPYSSEMDKTVRIASALVENYSHKYLKENNSSKEALLVISSDRGLCGSYNSTLAKKVKVFMSNKNLEDLDFYFIGRKVKDLIVKDIKNNIKTFNFEKNEPTYGEVNSIVAELAALFTEGKISKLHVAYNSFASVIEFN